MFPQFEVTTQDVESIESAESTRDIGKVFQFDFDNNKYVVENGKLVQISKIEAVKQFIRWTLKTQIRKFKIYDADYGIDRDTFIGQKTLPTGFINSELKRQIDEQLVKHPYITRIENFSHTRASNNLFIEFDVITTLNETLNISEVI